MGHHRKGHHSNNSNSGASGGFFTKLLAGGALLGVGKKIYDNKDKIKEMLIPDDKDKDDKRP